jgi:hypothetical protein
MFININISIQYQSWRYSSVGREHTPTHAHIWHRGYYASLTLAFEGIVTLRVIE